MSIGVEYLLPDLNEDQWDDEPIERAKRPHEEPDERLETMVVEAQMGDKAATLQVAQTIEKKAYEAVRSLTSDTEYAAILATEGLNRALQNGIINGQYSRYFTRKGEKEVLEGDFKGWVWTVVRRHALSKIEREERETEHRTKFSDEYMERLAGPQRASDAADEHEGYNLVNALLKSVDMPETHRDVIRLRLLGYEYAEIAKELGIPEGTALSRHHRGIKYLRQHFSLTSDGRIPDIFANLSPVKPKRHETTPSHRR